jgi:predicted PurR-regulated permease PerM
MANDSAILPGWTARQVVEATLVVLVVALGFLLLYRLYSIVFTLFIAIVISLAIRPLVDILSRRGLPRWAGISLVLLAILLALIAFVILAAPLFVRQAVMLADRIPQYYDQLRTWLLESGSILLVQLGARLPQGLPTIGPPAAGSGAGLDTVAKTLGIAGDFGRGMFTLLAVIVLTFYWSLEGEWIIRSALLRLPMAQRSAAADLLAAMEDKVGAYLRAQALLSLVVGAAVAAACLLIGLPYAFLLGLLAATFESIPLVGTVLASFFPILVAFTLAPSQVIWVIVAVVIIQETEAHLLAPCIMNTTVGVHPIVTILALTALASFFGLTGAILAVPLAAIIQLLLDHFVLGPIPLELRQPEGRGQVSALRHRAIELAEDIRKRMRDREATRSEGGDQIEDAIESIAMDLDSILAQAERGGQP